MNMKEVNKRWSRISKDWIDGNSPCDDHWYMRYPDDNEAIIYAPDDIKYLLSRIKKLEEGIKELVAYGMPRHIEDGFIDLLEEE